MNENNNILIGFAVGAITPILGYFVVQSLFEALSYMGLMDSGGTGYYSKRFRTLALFAICTNLIPLNFFKKRKWDKAMRGVVFPTLIYAAFWIYKYFSVLF